jgi:hypothetical protein
MLGLAVPSYFHYLVSYHLFRQSRRFAWWVRRLGGFSILREGVDREALRASAHILAAGKRPLLLFPEGTWFRQNDRLAPIQEGAALIARLAAKSTDRPVVIHPVAMKYWLLEDPRPVLHQRLELLEARLGWHPQRHLDLIPRIDKLSSSLLAIKEVEHYGAAQAGSLTDRLQRLTESHVATLEQRYWGGPQGGWIMERIRRLRQLLVGQLPEAAVTDSAAYDALQAQLADLLFCESLVSHSPAYLYERPSLERLSDAVQRLEEIVTDCGERPVANWGVVVEVGPGLDVRDFPARKGAGRQEEDRLTKTLARSIQGMLDELLAQGPPAAWHCPPRLEAQSGTGTLQVPPALETTSAEELKTA